MSEEARRWDEAVKDGSALRVLRNLVERPKHRVIVAVCQKCGGPMCFECQRPIDTVIRGFTKFWCHARRIGCR